MLVRKRVVIASSLSLIIFTSTISVLMGIGTAPDAVMGNTDSYVIMSKDTTSVLNSRLDASLAEQLISNGIVQNASPEIFAFASVAGSALIVRGVDFDQFMTVEGADLLSGVIPSALDGALIGRRLADRIGLDIGDVVVLTGSYRPAVCEVRIEGVIYSESGVGDELIISLPLARCLSGISSSSISIIRVNGNVSYLDKIFGPDNARFSIYDFSIPVGEVGLGADVNISLKLKNWGDVNGTADIVVLDETANETIASSSIAIASDQSTTLHFTHAFNSTGDHALRASLGGLLPQNITMNVTVRAPFLRLFAPAKVAEYNNFTATVVDQALSPVDGALVSVGSYSYVTNSSGKCVVNASLAPGAHTISADRSGYEGASQSVEVVNSSSLPNAASIEIYDIQLTSQSIKIRENCTIVIYVQNFGNKSGSGYARIYVDDYLYVSKYITLAPLESRILYQNITFSTAGEREISGGSISKLLTVESFYAINPQIIQLLLRYGGSGSLDVSSSQLIYNTAKISESNIVIVLASLAILSGTLVTMGVSTGFMKEIHDNQKVIGILRSLGASSRQLMLIIFKEAFAISLPAAIIGIIGGSLLAWSISFSESLIAFGHTIEPSLDPSFLLLAVIGSMVICVGSSLLAGLVASRKATIRMIKGLRDDGRPQVELRELIGEE